MIVVKIELHSARTGKVSELGRMNITNNGLASTEKRADYDVEIMRKGTTNKVQRRGLVRDYPRQAYTVWELVRRALEAGLSKWPIHPGHPEEFDEEVRGGWLSKSTVPDAELKAFVESYDKGYPPGDPGASHRPGMSVETFDLFTKLLDKLRSL